MKDDSIFIKCVNKGGFKNQNKIKATLILKLTEIKFMFSKKTTKIGEIFTIDLTLCCKCQMDGEEFINFCGLL